jgi:hypothetical protein
MVFMFAETIPLRFAGERGIVRVRELTGRDEFSVLGTNTANAIDLLSGLIDTGAIDLVAADRDRLLAAVYRRAFGDRIESTLTCSECKQPFDIDFSLSSVVASINESDSSGEWVRLADGRFEAANGFSFRLPTGRDELEAIGMPAQEVESLLLRRCTEGHEWPEGNVAFEELLEQVAPIIDLELVARCPECRHVQRIQFDIQTYLLGALLAERRRLLADINRIAGAYSWSLDEILSLARSDRRLLVELIETQHAA